MQKIRFLVLLLLCVAFQQAFAQQRILSGVITSAEDHEPLIGATISVQGSEAHGVVTDIEGKYRLEVGPNDKILVVAYLGMKTQLIKVPKKERLNIVLQPETMNLDEVVVTGYGNFTRSSFTGSANTLRGDMMKDIPVMSVEQKLQGMTTGVSISSSSGQPGANQSIRIRGMGSFNASQEPLFVIDGVPVTSGSLSRRGRCSLYEQLQNQHHEYAEPGRYRKYYDYQGCGSRFFVWFAGSQWGDFDYHEERKGGKSTGFFQHVGWFL